MPQDAPRSFELPKVTGRMARAGRVRSRRIAAHSVLMVCLCCVIGLERSAAVELVDLGTVIRIHPQTKLVFADVSRAREILMQRDRFVQQMSDLDRQLRLRGEPVATEAVFLRQLGDQARAWSNEEMMRIRDAIQPAIETLSKLQAVWPETVVLVKTTARVEDGAPHCRQAAIVLPEPFMSEDANLQRRILVHELFHVLSSHSPELRSRLYNLIGFQECPPIELPEDLQRRKITNPDAPTVNCVTQLNRDDRTWYLAPLLLSRHDLGELPRDTTIFRELDFRLVVIEPVAAGWRVAVEEDRPTLFEPRDFPEWWSKIGRNTHYIIHPEEILADNFAHLILASERLPDPWLVERMAALLRP